MATKLKPLPRMKTTIYVGKLAWTVGVTELKNHFTQFGRVTHASVVYNKDTGLSKGYGFVTFNNEESAKSVLNSKHVLNNVSLKVGVISTKKLP